LIPIELVHPEHLRFHIEDQPSVFGKKRPLTFEYVLLFFMLPKNHLWTAGSITPRGWSKTDSDYTRHYNNIYQFGVRNGIHQRFDNRKTEKNIPAMWDSDTWVDALSVHDYNRGVSFFLCLWNFNEKMKAAGRTFKYAYSSSLQDLILIENTPSLAQPQKMATAPAHRTISGKLLLVAAMLLGALITGIPFLYRASHVSDTSPQVSEKLVQTPEGDQPDAAKLNDFFSEIMIGDPSPPMYHQTLTAQKFSEMVKTPAETHPKNSKEPEPAHRDRVYYMGMSPGR